MLAMFAHGVPSVLYVLLYGGTLHFQLGQNKRACQKTLNMAILAFL
jgi:hypothetical protein